MRELKLLRPNLILAYGRDAIRIITGSQITTPRLGNAGKVLRMGENKAIVLLEHPGSLMRKPSLISEYRSHISKIVSVYKGIKNGEFIFN